MRNEARGDVWKVWLYAVASVVLGAWMAPFLYNAGKALAEISADKSMNRPLKWLAGYCQTADFAGFFKAGLVLVAGLLLFPWLEWLHVRRHHAWLAAPHGRHRISTWWGPWQTAAGFLLTSGLVLAPGMILDLWNRGFMQRMSVGGMGLQLGGALLAAMLMEGFFRGLVLGVFLRAMRPAAALAMSAVLFALVLSVIAAAGLNAADPEVSGAGFGLLDGLAAHFADWNHGCAISLPLLALGGVLAYARWRTASLWLPVGLQCGWLFSIPLRSGPGDHPPFLTNNPLPLAGVDLTSILLSGVLLHYLTVNPNHADAGRS